MAGHEDFLTFSLAIPCLKLLVETKAVSTRKTKTKLINLASHKRQSIQVNQSKLKANTCRWRETRENMCTSVHDMR